MTDDLDRHRRVMAVFERVRELPPPERAAALAEACEANSALHQEVTRLLAADARAGSFLEHGPGPAITGSDYLIGTRIGPYEIHASIGAGAMGEVYRARDTKLRRDVALKILPAVFANDPDRRARFQREAQVLASLNHPHIPAIYGLEESDGVHALVLELVDGPTLADRIDGRPIAIDESRQIARQIVDGP